VGRALEDACRHLHGRYISLSPGLIATIDGNRQVVADLVRPGRRRRSLKMTLTPKSRRPESGTSMATAARRSRQ
jgi:hypothetical protein